MSSTDRAWAGLGLYYESWQAVWSNLFGFFCVRFSACFLVLISFVGLFSSNSPWPPARKQKVPSALWRLFDFGVDLLLFFTLLFDFNFFVCFLQIH